MKKKYKYNTLPKRDVFIERLLDGISQQNKDATELMIDCNKWYEEHEGRELLTPEQLRRFTIFLHFRYTKLQDWVEAEIDEFNRIVNELDKGSHIVEE